MSLYKNIKTDFINLGWRPIFMLFLLSVFHVASANVVINEVQISPINERFIELYNPDASSVDLTGWYIQRKTATGSTFSSLVTSTQTNGKSIKAGGYFLISHIQLGSSDVVLDSFTLTESNTLRMRDSKGVDVDSVTWGTIDDTKSYARGAGGAWTIGTPTPGTSNETVAAPAPTQPQDTAVSQDTTTSAPESTSSSAYSSFPVDPQIFADAGARTRTVSVGASINFSGRVWGLKKEPIENARMEWSFGDGARADGPTVSHVYFYPGEYTVVLDAASGYYSGSDRVHINVVTPLISLHTGGDSTRSFVTINNLGNEELDLSAWQVSADKKTFILPKNTLVAAHKTLTLASEVSGLTTASSTVASLSFPNGVNVPLVGAPVPVEIKAAPQNIAPVIVATMAPTEVESARVVAPKAQTANVIAAVSETDGNTATPAAQESSLWMWYAGVALLGALAAIGLRLARRGELAPTTSADDFEIIEEDVEEIH